MSNITCALIMSCLSFAQACGARAAKLTATADQPNPHTMFLQPTFTDLLPSRRPVLLLAKANSLKAVSLCVCLDGAPPGAPVR